MFSRKRFFPSFLCLFLIAGLLPGGEARAGTFLIDGSAAGLSGTTIKDNETLIGLVDDYIELSDGDHVLRFQGPHNHRLLLTVKVRGDLIRMVETDFRPTDCGQVYDITWPKPRVGRDPAYRGVRHIKLAPVRAVPTEESVPCASMAMAACNEQKSIVEFKSDPPGGEIWFSGPYGSWQKHDFRTNVTLSVPFCPNFGAAADTKPESVLVRMEGRVNCQRELALSPDAKLTVDCALLTPGAGEAADAEPSTN